MFGIFGRILSARLKPPLCKGGCRKAAGGLSGKPKSKGLSPQSPNGDSVSAAASVSDKRLPPATIALWQKGEPIVGDCYPTITVNENQNIVGDGVLDVPQLYIMRYMIYVGAGLAPPAQSLSLVDTRIACLPLIYSRLRLLCGISSSHKTSGTTLRFAGTLWR